MTEPKPVYESRKTKADLRAEINQMRQNSVLTARALVANGLGKSFSGARDLYKVLGYAEKLTYDDFANVYSRDGLATRIVDAVSDETWRENPVLIEGENKKSDELDKPSQLQIGFAKLADRLDLFTEFNDADAYCGISRYAVLVLGLPGKMSDPAPLGKKLAYVMAHDEGSAIIATGDIEANVNSERFGLPNFYTVTMDVDNASATQRIHWSRCIHIREGRTKSRTYGVPRLKSMYNRIQDLEKVVGGGSEAFWLLIHRGLALTAKEGTTLPPINSDAYKDMEDEVDEYEHGISRIMRLIGLDVTDLGGKPVDSDAQFRTLVAYLSGSSRIPQRILIGSEAGSLASSQDEYNFASFIVSRQKKFAEPKILRAFIDKCGELGILDVPAEYSVEWPSLFQLTDAEKATIASTVAGAMNSATGGVPESVMPPAEFAQRYLDYVPETPDPVEVLKTDLPTREPSPEGDNHANVPINIEALKPKSWQLHTEPVGWDLLNTQPLKPENSIYPTDVTPVPAYDETRVKIVLSSKAIALWHNENDTSAMIAFKIPDNLRAVLRTAYPFMDKAEQDNMHVTLCFLGDNRSLDMDAVARACRNISNAVDPIKVELQGIARFVSGNEIDPIVLTVDSPKLPSLHSVIVDALRKEGVPYSEEHGFIPHTTLAYIGKDAPMPIDTMEPLEVNFNEIYLVSGNEWTPFWMGAKGDAPFLNEGNSDSGNHGHAGREGKVGGSAPSGTSVGSRVKFSDIDVRGISSEYRKMRGATPEEVDKFKARMEQLPDKIKALAPDENKMLMLTVSDDSWVGESNGLSIYVSKVDGQVAVHEFIHWLWIANGIEQDFGDYNPPSYFLHASGDSEWGNKTEQLTMVLTAFDDNRSSWIKNVGEIESHYEERKQTPAQAEAQVKAVEDFLKGVGRW